MNPFRNILVNARNPSWPSRFITRFTVLVLAAALAATTALSSHALSVAPKSDNQKGIDHLYELAIAGEENDAAIDGIIAYAERGDVNIYDRQYAFERLEALAEPKLMDYLEDVALGEIEFEDSRLLRDFANRAYWLTQFAEAVDAADEERILVAGLKAVVSLRIEGQETPNNMGESRLVRNWAADELCRRGRSEHFEKIKSSLDPYQSNQKAQERIEFCRQQLEVLNKFEDRQAAFEYILATGDPTFEYTLDNADSTSDEKLIDWAVKELIESQPIDLEEILIDYIARLFEDFEEDEIGFSFYRPFSYLRDNNWTNEDFAARGIGLDPF